MSAFTQDVIQRKDLARQSRHRKNGSKSKKCSLPSDKITQKQWKDRCGELMVYNLGSPMSWERFKAMPLTYQTEYLTELQSKYGATCRVISEMFEVSPLTLHRHIKTNSLDIQFKRGSNMSIEQSAKWASFICPENPEHKEIQVSEEALDSSVEEAQHNDVSAPMDMSAMMLEFRGNVDVDMIANSLRNIVGNGGNAVIKIEYTKCI